MHWPAPTNEDLYVRVRRWHPPGAAAPAGEGQGEGKREGRGDGAGAGAGDGPAEGAGEGVGDNKEEEGAVQAERAGQQTEAEEEGAGREKEGAEKEEEGGFGPEHLVCVPGGLRPSACLALLREAVEAVRPLRDTNLGPNPSPRPHPGPNPNSYP